MYNFFTKNLRKKIISLIIAVLVYVGLQTLSMTLLKKVYMFDWMGRNLYCYTWVLSVILIVFNRTMLSCFVTFGTLVGTLLGQFLGDYIRVQRMNLITPDMDPGKVQMLSIHYGVFICVITYLLFLIVGIVLEIIFCTKRKRLTQTKQT